MFKAFFKNHKKGIVLSVLGGAAALASYVIDEKKSENDLEAIKLEVKEDVLEEIRQELENDQTLYSSEEG